MKNLRIKMKLLLGFGLITLMAIVVGVVGAIGMMSLSQSDADMYDYNVVGMDLIGSIRENYALQRVNLRSLILFDAGTDYFESAVKKLETLDTEMGLLINNYLPIAVKEEDLEAFNQFRTHYNGGFSELKRVISELARQNEADRAKEHLTSPDILKLSDAIDECLDKCYELNVAFAKNAVEANSALASRFTTIQVVILAVACVVCVILTIYVSRIICRPLSLLTSFMKGAKSTGDIALRQEDVENIEKYGKVKDEIGECIGACAEFMARLNTVNKSLETVAAGDITVDIDLLSERDTMGLSLSKMTDSLNKMFWEIKNATNQVTSGSKQVSDGAQMLAHGSSEQAAAVEELSSSISNIAQKTDENAEMALRASRLAQTIKQNAEKGSGQMEQMLVAVKEIQEASRSIGKVIKVIDDIAFQTNILALNAAVEAARAGQHGKGFAVVAEEVRNLAAKSAAAAKDTGSLIANSMEKSEMGARIAGETAESLSEIVSGIDESGQIIDDIARSSEEQAAAIGQINSGIDQVAHVVQKNSATAQESAAAAEEMSEQSDMLEDLIRQFKIKGSENTYEKPKHISMNTIMPAKTLSGTDKY